MPTAMAATTTTSATATSTYFVRPYVVIIGTSFSSNYSIRFTKKQNARLIVRSSADGSPASPELGTATEVEESIEEGQIEVPKGPPSLISALNVEKALRGIAIVDVDYYGTLGLKRGCPYDQVKVAYDQKIEELMNQGLEQEELSKQLDLLKEAYTILSSVEDRRLYDWTLARSANPDRYAWPFEVDITQTVDSPDTPPPQEPEDVQPTRFTGYFLLTWIILSIALSVAFNR